MHATSSRLFATFSVLTMAAAGALVAVFEGAVLERERALAAPAPSAVTDVNPGSTPTPLWGGRVERVSVDPVNSAHVLAASELGGLWRSTDAGLTWSHVDALNMAITRDVVIAQADSDLVIATGLYDGRQTSGGGIWRSTDGGQTWSKPATADPPCTTEPSAFNVAIGQGTPGSLPVFVATSCGLAVSTNSGATWTHVDPASGFSNGVTGYRGMDDVITRVTGGNVQVDVCGTQGFFRSSDGGSTWSAPDPSSPTFRDADGPGPLGGAFGPCSLAVDPADATTVYLANFSNATSSGFCQGQLLESNNAGAAGTWTAMGVTDANCRDAFVQTQASNDGDPTHYDVYFGTSVRLLRQRCDRDNAPTNCLTGAGNWPRWDQNTPHTDPAHIAFNPMSTTGCPILVAGDFGMMRPTSDGCGAMPTLAMTNSGLHAFDSSQMAGMVAPGAMQLYFGTQDNGIYSSVDGGATWTNRGPDVYAVHVDRAQNPDAAVLWRPCFGCAIIRSTPGLVADIAWTSPPGADIPNNYVATQFGPRSYAFVTPDVGPGPGVDQIWTVYVTTDAGANWTRFGSALPGDPVPGGGPGPGSHGAIQASGPANNPTFYVNLNVAGTGLRIYRLSGILDTSQSTNAATLTQVSNGLNAPVNFGVDPVNPNLLYATDTGTQRMMRSSNGGASWAADNALTSQVTGNGVFKFVSNGRGEQARSIGFDPFSDTVFVGTATNGLFASVNNGLNWIRVRGSEQLPLALDFAFDNIRNQAYVGTRGRGVWRIDLPRTDLTLVKTDSPDPAVAGEHLTYTLTATNTGTATASALSVTDTLPVGVHYVTSSVPCTSAPAVTGDVVTCPLLDLAPGATRTFTITTYIDPDVVSDNGGPLTLVNSATLTSGETVDTNLANNTATTTTVVNDKADLIVQKICDPRQAKAGETIHCTVFADNFGPSDARGVVITDRVLSGGSFTISNVNGGAGSTCTPVTAVPGGKQFECNVGTIRAATTTTAGRKTLTYDITATEGQELDNLAKVRSDTPDPDDSNNEAPETLSITSVADLSLIKSGPASVVAGNAISWTLRAVNNGPSTATNVVLEDTLPAGIAVSSVSAVGASCVPGVPGDPIQPARCTYSSLAPGATTTDMTVQGRVLPGTTGVLHNAARVSSDTLDQTNSNDLDAVRTTVTTSADVAVTKLHSPNPVVAGTPITYTVTVSNNGPSTARNVSVVDSLPGNVGYSGTTIEHGTGVCNLTAGNPNRVECQVGDLAPSDYVILYVNGNVRSSAPQGSTLDNSVTVGSTTPDPTAGNNTAATSSSVNAVADLAVTLLSDAAVYKPSTTIHYAITVVNNGPSDAVNVVVTQQLPPSKFGYFVSNDKGCTVSGSLLTCPTIPSLPAGGSFSTVVNWFVQGSKGTITSTAYVSSATTDPVSGNNSSKRSVLRK